MTGPVLFPLLLALGCGVPALAADAPTTWRRWELVLDGWPTGTAADITFSGPRGAILKVPAFESGGALRARVAFPEAGDWRWQAKPAGAGSVSRSGRVMVSAYTGANPLYRHGFLRVSKNGRNLEHADGTPFLWMGDTAWFGLTRGADAEWSEYLDFRVRGRFSVIQVAALGAWPKLLPASVPIPRPFRPDGEPDDAYWDRIEARIAEANERGLVVLLIGLARPPQKADLPNVDRTEYARYVAARFFGDHVIFSPNFDQRYQPLFDRVAENLRGFTTLHLITQHPNTQNLQNDIYVPKAYLGFTGLQSGHHEGDVNAAYTAAREWPARLRSLQPAKPVINIEAMYDGRGDNGGTAWREQDARKLGWISWLSGALGYTYGAGETARKVPGSAGGMWGFNQDPGAWDCWRKAVVWPSAAQMTVLRDFFASLEWWRLEPAPRRLHTGVASPERQPLFALADNRSFGVAYLPASGALTLDLGVFSKPVNAVWIDPLSGRRIRADEAPNQDAREFTPPAGDHDWVLLLANRAGNR
jgi:hypothetical protein